MRVKVRKSCQLILARTCLWHQRLLLRNIRTPSCISSTGLINFLFDINLIAFIVRVVSYMTSSCLGGEGSNVTYDSYKILEFSYGKLWAYERGGLKSAKIAKYHYWKLLILHMRLNTRMSMLSSLLTSLLLLALSRQVFSLLWITNLPSILSTPLPSITTKMKQQWIIFSVHSFTHDRCQSIPLASTEIRQLQGTGFPRRTAYVVLQLLVVTQINF